ncbi:RNA-directed DNA polymerase, eukaryota [Tanacetum coccineum]
MLKQLELEPKANIDEYFEDLEATRVTEEYETVDDPDQPSDDPDQPSDDPFDPRTLAEMRPPRGGVEQEQFMALLSLVKDIQLVPMEDRWSWSLSSSGEFSVSSVRRLIDDKTLPDATQKTRWVRLVPIKINVHAWKVKSNSLPTRFNISRRGILIDSLKCGTCDMGVETVNHLFFSCTLVRNLVDLIVRWWNVTRVDIDSYSDWVLWIQNLRLPIKNKRMLEGVFYIMWKGQTVELEYDE